MGGGADGTRGWRDGRAPAPEAPGPQQHDLAAGAAAAVVAGAAIVPGERVVDAGAGLGALAAAALAAGAVVTAVELAPDRLAHLRRRFAGAIAERRIEVVAADLTAWHPAFAGPWRVVANPPFHLTATLVRGWVVAAHPPRALDLVLQRQAAEKLAGRGTRAGALLACAGRAHVSARLPRDATSPPSRVDLAVWRFRRADGVAARDLALVEALLAVAFAGPHTVAEALRGVASAVQLRRQGDEHGWDPRAHPRQVPPAAWLPLARLVAARLGSMAHPRTGRSGRS